MSQDINYAAKEYRKILNDYFELSESPVFRKLFNRRIQPRQVTVDNSLKVFALELKRRHFESAFSLCSIQIYLTEKFPGLLDNLRTPGRYWVSWWTANTPEVGVMAWPESLKIWNSGSFAGRDSLCAMVETDRETSLAQFWEHLVTYFPDAEVRFCTIKGYHEIPGDRFIDFDPARTFLRSPKNPKESETTNAS